MNYGRQFRTHSYPFFNLRKNSVQVEMISFLSMWPPDLRALHRLLGGGEVKGFVVVDKFEQSSLERSGIFEHG